MSPCECTYFKERLLDRWLTRFLFTFYLLCRNVQATIIAKWNVRTSILDGKWKQIAKCVMWIFCHIWRSNIFAKTELYSILIINKCRLDNTGTNELNIAELEKNSVPGTFASYFFRTMRRDIHSNRFLLDIQTTCHVSGISLLCSDSQRNGQTAPNCHRNFDRSVGERMDILHVVWQNCAFKIAICYQSVNERPDFNIKFFSIFWFLSLRKRRENSF